MQAIETIYKGYRFRSRLEARWAIFFDALGLKWEYEPEGFKLPSGKKYLPDFKVTSPQKLVSWYEVKPPDYGECGKIKELEGEFMKEAMSGDDLPEDSFLTLQGDPYTFLNETQYKHTVKYMNHLLGIESEFEQVHNYYVCPRCGNIGLHDRYEYGNEAAFNCDPCDKDTPCGGGNPEEKGLFGMVRPHKGAVIIEGNEYFKYLSKLNNAITAARSARFEHGENPF